MSKRHRPLVAAFALVAVFSADHAVAQTKTWEVLGAGRADSLGRSLTYTPDADGDGVPDLLIGAPNDRGVPGNPGRALLYSGATNQLIREFDGDVPDDAFGTIVANLGDVDADGLPDFAIAAPRRYRDIPGVPEGAVFVYSGAGPLIRSYTSVGPDGKVGEAMAALGDIDGDGANDLVYSDLNAGLRTIFVVSGATGATIQSVRGTSVSFGYAVGRTGDTNGDGVEDFAVCDADSGGHVQIYSGSTGSKLVSFAGLEAIVKPAGDVDSDGHADLILANVGSGKVPVVSGATGKALYTFTGNAFIGSDVSSTGDFDGDGISDLVVLQGITRANPYDVFIYSGVNGALLLRYTLGSVSTVDATADLDGDGVSDIIGGNDSWSDFGPGPAGRVSVASGATGSHTYIDGESFVSKLATSLTVVNDRDGDGFRDVAIAVSHGFDVNRVPVVEIVSGFDGHEISRIAPASGVSDRPHALVLTGDADGDGIDDLAFTGVSAVEVRSGRDDSLIATFTPSSGSQYNDVAAASDVNGAPLLAVTTVNPSGFVVFDLTTGGVVTTMTGHGDSQIACVGDVDGDGFVDWVVYDWKAYTVTLVTGGPAPTVLWTFTGTGTDGISSVTSTGDLDGDGTDDVLIGWTGGARATARSGKTGGMLNQVSGPGSPEFGRSVSSLGDVNGDGVCDFAVGSPFSGTPQGMEGAVHVFSGATFERLTRIDGEWGKHYFGYEFAQRRWHDDARIDPDPIPDLVCGRCVITTDRGRAETFRLPPLFLWIDPPAATAGQKIVIGTHGGPAGAAAGLYAVALDGVPVDTFVAFGTFGPLGNWSIKPIVPIGLAGHTLTLRSYAIGFSGKVVVSSDETLTFQ